MKKTYFFAIIELLINDCIALKGVGTWNCLKVMIVH